MKTYYIKKEDCKDIGWAYEIEGKEYDGNLVIDVVKTIVIKGDQVVKGNQVVKGDQVVRGNQVVEGDQVVRGNQDVSKKCITGTCKHNVYFSKKLIKIGCKEKKTSEWVEWFNGKEEYETKRDSLAFNQIYKTFLMAKVAQENDEGLAE